MFRCVLFFYFPITVRCRSLGRLLGQQTRMWRFARWSDPPRKETEFTHSYYLQLLCLWCFWEFRKVLCGVFLTVNLQTSDGPADKASGCETHRKHVQCGSLRSFQEMITSNIISSAQWTDLLFQFWSLHISTRLLAGWSDSWSAGGESCIYGPDTTDLHRQIAPSWNSALTHLRSGIFNEIKRYSSATARFDLPSTVRYVVLFLIRWLDYCVDSY